MTAPAQWTANPAVQQAVQARDYATILRFSRLAAGLTLEQLGAAGGYSTSTLSRLESGRRAIRDVTELRTLADLYDVPVELFGLATAPGHAGGSTLAATVDGGGGTVHRRNFLAGAAVVGAAAALPASPAPAAPTGPTIEDVLFSRHTAEPLPGPQLAAQIAAARADYRATRYTRLARRLPRLLAQAEAGRSAAAVGEQAAAAQRLAEAYGVATQLLTKLYDNGLACATADRAVQAAGAGNDPLIMAESQRLAATILRRVDHRGSAQKLVLDAADQLRTSGAETGTSFHAMYGQLLAVAAYTAAIRDDRDTAWTLLAEAEQPAQAAGPATRFNTTELAVYRIGIARKLGDYGAAVDHARKVDPRSITDAERRARYWEDTALALHGRGRPTAAFETLLAAERDVPEEVRYRPWSQQLTRDLLSAPAGHGLSGVRDFAARIGVA
ncbi:helix-turn-helix domain-containing protein [Paractinoplanes rhizophilus]|uniref:Helix-turn-helix domain-containing protein n=1 Tax=Paractinoplanes rhizophilus TaxID=1416877 RepID=A0ABW2I4H5_9ACTN